MALPPRPSPPAPRHGEDADTDLNTAIDHLVDGVPTTIRGQGIGEPKLAPLTDMEDEATAVDQPAHTASGPLSLPPMPRAPDEVEFAARYRPGEVLGLGGMGEVRLCTDARIGRVVAMKSIRPEGAKRQRLIARFLLEAKMQGQLEHPSIVPVYDLGVRPDGSEFFTMRRVRGRTLYEVLRSLRNGERGAATTFSRRRLLAALQSISLAVEFAHQRGVVHRDLKPANLMLGEFGEVILLDWGLAKLTPRDPTLSFGPESGLSELKAVDHTAVGEVLGSPGYMSPEQAVDSQSVGPAADIFALGAMLFEVLTLERLIPGVEPQSISRHTIAGKYDARISRRFPDLDVPPELEAICVKACEHDPSKRYERARELADAIERYLEGDRDVARRRSMAGRHTRAAIAALAESVEAVAPEDQKAARARAIREVNHALAIDPQNQTALRTMMKIITDAPTAVAPEAEAALREGEDLALQKMARRGAWSYLSATGNIAVMGLLGVVSPAWLGAACGCFLAASMVAFLGSRRPQRVPPNALTLAVIGLSSLGIAASSLLFGALVYAPSLCAANVVVFAAGVERRFRYAALAAGIAAILVPLILEHLGVLPPGWVFTDGGITILPRAISFPGIPTVLVLGAASLGTVIFPALLVGADRDARAKAERELLVRSHTLAEFVPAEAKAGTVGEGRPTLRSIPPPSVG